MCWFCQLQPVCINDVQPEPLWCPSSKDHPGFRPQQQHPTSTVLGPVEWSGCFTVSLGSGFPRPQVPSCLTGWWEGWGCQGVQEPASRKPRVPGGKSPPFKTSCNYFIRRETVTFTHLVDVVCGDFELNLRASNYLKCPWIEGSISAILEVLLWNGWEGTTAMLPSQTVRGESTNGSAVLTSGSIRTLRTVSMLVFLWSARQLQVTFLYPEAAACCTMLLSPVRAVVVALWLPPAFSTSLSCLGFSLWLSTARALFSFWQVTNM